ncbi:VCBS domain-containing protein [Microvirga brassicacearum]|uniref:DUF4347 domain-containing protein n=1 Tax=Microvirga brassicacearum TaxID=2580413 RepID=A0A5N3P5Q0_9HYPH|nr:VCBS domain-containing protein [Microvirga brassicacearum]KAB0265077.1 DUF4347 domain-containing protein [Microvirga brassicacearum]
MTTRTINLGHPARASDHTIHAARDAAVDRNTNAPLEREAVREIVFVDPNISDLSTLLQGVRPEIEAHLLTPHEPASRQMARVVAGRRGLEAIHVIAHGRPGQVSFAAGALSLDAIESEAELRDFGPALGADGALHIWACQTGAGERGAAFMNALAEKTGVHVAAASGLVGAEERGGTWTLDRGATSGRPPLTVEGMAAYAGVMATFTGTSGANVADATTGTIAGFSGGTVTSLTDSTGDTFIGNAGADTIVAGGGNDTINIANGNFVAGESIQGGGNTSTGTGDQIVLTNATTVDFSTGTVSGVETLTGTTGNDTVTMTASQWAGFRTIDLGGGGGTDVLNVVASGNISALAAPTVSKVEVGNLVGTSGTDTVTLTGAQLDAILIGAGTINLSGGTDTINLTSTSADLNTLGATNASIQGVEAISAAGAVAGVSINLSGQSEAFTITGGAGNDTIAGGTGAGDTVVLSGARADYTISLSGSTYTIVDNRSGSPDATDTVTGVENFQFSNGTLSAGQLDLTAPTISAVAFGNHDGTLKAGEGVDLVITFSEAVTVTGTPTLTLSNGAIATLVGGSGTNTLTFHYTAASGEDTSDITIASYNLAANGATIKDSQGNLVSTAGATTDPGGPGDIVAVDTLAPVASITLGPITADNLISVAEASGTVTVTGTVGGEVEDGDIVTLTVNGTLYSGAVSNGTFGIEVLGNDLAADGDSIVEASVTTTDAAGNSTTVGDAQSYTGPNDAPVVNTNGGPLAYTENQAPGAIGPALTVSDADNTTLTGATVSITGNFASGEDVLGFTDQNGITGSYDLSTGILTLSGTATAAQYQAALQSVTYFNASDAPSGSARTISFQVDDGQTENHSSNVATAVVSVTPVNDAAIIGGVTIGTGDEDAAVTVSGTVAADDLDNPDNTFEASFGNASYGGWAIDAAGNWTYTLDNGNSAVDALNDSDTLSDSFTILSADGTGQLVTVTITGTNDAAIIGGVTTGTVSEDAAVTVSGTLTAVDVDNPDNAFQAGSGNAGYGSWSVDAAGIWSYTLDSGNPAVDALNSGDTLSDTFTILSVDGTTQQVTVTISGSNDAAIIGGVAIGTTDENAATTVSGTLIANDIDNPDNAFQAGSGNAGYGSWSIDAAGDWTYALDNGNPAVDSLNDGDALNDSFTVLSADGTTQQVTVTITGTNDAAIIGGGVADTVAENAATPTASGTLTADDLDNPDNVFQVGSGNASYGRWSINAAGEWSYTLDNDNPAVDALNDGDTLNDSFTILSADGTEQLVTVTITGTNDAAVIGGVTTGTVGEDATVTVSGTVTGDDLDNPDNTFQAGSGNASYGIWSINAAGSWTYTLNNDNPAVDALNLGDTLNDTFAVLSTDGTVQQVTVIITGSNDAAVLSSAAVDLTETDAALTTGGTLTNADVDSPSTFQAQSDTIGAYGTFSIDASGAWSYTASSAFDELGDGETLTDTYSVSAADGTTTSVTVTIIGTNDAAIIGGIANGAVDEDAVATVSGTLTANDIDNPDNAFQAGSGNASYGAWSIDAAGNWTYTPDNANPAVDALNSGDTLSDTFTILSADGTTRQVTVTITGTNDGAIIGGVTTGTVDEDAAATVSGTLTADDIDNPDNVFQAGSGSASFGSWSIDAAGIWSYTLDNDNPAVDALNASDTLGDTFTIHAIDGTTQQVTVTITGTNDAAIIGGVVAGTVDEDAATPTVSGTLTADDVDNPDNAFQAGSGNASYGIWSINAAGIWNYTLDDANPAVDALDEGETLNDSFTILSADGTEQLVTVTITGTNDAAVIGGVTTDTVGEDATVTVSGTVTGDDVDNPDNTFQAGSGNANYGSWSINAAGIWNYTLNNANPAVDALNASDTLNDTFTILSVDGTAQEVTVTITGANDAAVIGGVVAGTVDEDAATPIASGTLTADDIDNPDNAFQSGSGSSSYGSWSIDATGNWTYTLDNGNPVVNALNAGDTLIDIFTILSVDGTAQQMTVTIAGSNDAAVLSSAAVNVSETDVALTTSGTLTNADVDSPSTFLAQTDTAGTYGTFSIDADGAWTFTASSAFDELGAGDTRTDTYSAAAADGTMTSVTVTIIGTNDAAIIDGVTGGTVGEDAAAATVSGTLTADDIDNSDNAFQAGSGSSSYGSWSIDATGNWTYTLDNGNPVVNALNAGGTLSDIFTVHAIDGTAQQLTVTIAGANDAVINHAPTGINLSGVTVTELAASDTLVADITANDADAGETFRFDLLNPDGRFKIVGSKILVDNGLHLDFEQARSHDITVQVTDKGGASFVKSFTINVGDVAQETAKGGAISDKFVGGTGNDKLWGGLGNDFLTGGRGKDTFVFDTKLDKRKNVDTITDFSSKDDAIYLDNAIFKKLGKKGSPTTPAKMDSKMFWAGTKAHDKDDRIIYDKKSGALYYDADGVGGASQIKFGQVKKGISVTYKDFFVI